MDTTQLIKYYEERFDLISHPGWKSLMEDAKEYRQAVADITTISSGEELQERKGQLKALDWLLTMKDVWEKAYEDVVNEINE
jgi:ribosomal protein L17